MKLWTKVPDPDFGPPLLIPKVLCVFLIIFLTIPLRLAKNDAPWRGLRLEKQELTVVELGEANFYWLPSFVLILTSYCLAQF